MTKIFVYSLNASKRNWLKRPIGVAKTVSSLLKFKNISSEKLNQLKTRQLKRRTYNKMQWGVRAYNEWRCQKLSDPITYDIKILEADLSNVKLLEKEAFVHGMCQFIPEVTKVRDGKDYPGKTLYEMVTSIQKFLHENDKPWKVIDGPEFLKVKTVLDNVMKEWVQQNLGMVKKQAQFITLDYENELWDRGILGEDTLDKLRSTVLYLLGVNLGLRAGDEHYGLHRDTSEKPSQLSFKCSNSGKCCFVYREDSMTKTNDGGLNSLKRDRKVIWVFPSDNVVRDPVRLVYKYVSLLPPVGPKTKKFNFYLRSLENPNLAQWYRRTSCWTSYTDKSCV